jgi:hypothetical protein
MPLVIKWEGEHETGVVVDFDKVVFMFCDIAAVG